MLLSHWIASDGQRSVHLACRSTSEKLVRAISPRQGIVDRNKTAYRCLIGVRPLDELSTERERAQGTWNSKGDAFVYLSRAAESITRNDKLFTRGHYLLTRLDGGPVVGGSLLDPTHVPHGGVVEAVIVPRDDDSAGSLPVTSGLAPYDP